MIITTARFLSGSPKVWDRKVPFVAAAAMMAWLNNWAVNQPLR
ncbi:Uncharacterised protein [Vibrio cholerae]|nr:Uncharacterised protein [Vibrio cholerae]